jgi:hypothetical protein
MIGVVHEAGNNTSLSMGPLGSAVQGNDHTRFQTVSRFRPLARRLFNTLRPAAVDIRSRNPWVRFLFTLLG